jgi:hypothetical protein
LTIGHGSVAEMHPSVRRLHNLGVRNMTARGQREGRLEVHPDAIGHTLRDRLLTVPVYQRSYSWQIEQVTDFWRDLRSAMVVPDPEYFIGTLVSAPDEATGRHMIIDGQQRLATTTMLLAAIRNAYRDGGENSRAETVERNYIAAPDLDTDELQPRLRLNSEDDNFFYNLVIADRSEDVDTAPTYQSHHRILESYQLLQQWVDQSVKEAGPNWQALLSAWVKFLNEDVRVILVDVPNEAGAFQIFETLNDRGLDLTIADLLKNYLFSLSGSRLEVVKRSWTGAVSTLDISSENEMFVTFLRHYWSSNYGAVRERDLYKSIRDRIRSAQQAVDFAEQLMKSSRLYSALLSSDHEYWSEHGTSLKTDIETLLRLGLEQNRPLLLAAMQHFRPGELRKVIRATISWSVRGLVVGGIGGGTTERYYSETAVKIRNGTVKGLSDLFKDLSPIIPSDLDFENGFKQMRVTSPRLARYYLLAIERYGTGDKEPELIPNDDEGQVNLEHIFPKNPQPADWPNFSPDETNEWAPRLGNLVLLRKTANARLGNKAFTDKVQVIRRSDLSLTSMVAQDSDWSPATIRKRQDSLAQTALKVWPRQP